MSFKENVFYRITNDAPLGYHYLHLLACHARCLVVFLTITDFICKQMYGEWGIFRYINVNIPSSSKLLNIIYLQFLLPKMNDPSKNTNPCIYFLRCSTHIPDSTWVKVQNCDIVKKDTNYPFIITLYMSFKDILLYTIAYLMHF